MNKGERIKTTRPIDAFALKCAIEKRIDEINNEDFADGMAEAMIEIDCQPTVDAEPVRHGHWIDRNGAIVAPFWERYECSECGARSDSSKYCHNCGAKMDEEREEE